jgi:ferric-dicitrate binding protein FerR (iron transport regulator)
MKESHWELIAKHLASETSLVEEEQVTQLLKTDPEFKVEFESSKKIWDNINIPQNNFDEKRITTLRNQKIADNNKRRIMRSTLKYAAIFIGFVMGALFIYHDYNSTITVIAENENRLELNLPDGSNILMQKDAIVTYRNSLLFAFNREVSVQGQAFFNISKSTENNFIVRTNDFNIEVWGTKFDVNTTSEGSQVVLTEGKISLDGFNDKSINTTILAPGQMASINHTNNQLELKSVNTAIYTVWAKNQLDFATFSISELGEIFKIHYGKTLIVETNESLDHTIGGSAPTDNIDLIIKGLSIVLSREIIHKNDTIIIK